jgi:hypothetical protein
MLGKMIYMGQALPFCPMENRFVAGALVSTFPYHLTARAPGIFAVRLAPGRRGPAVGLEKEGGIITLKKSRRHETFPLTDKRRPR